MLTAIQARTLSQRTSEGQLNELLEKIERHARSGKLGYPVVSLREGHVATLKELGYKIKPCTYSDFRYTIWWGE